MTTNKNDRLLRSTITSMMVCVPSFGLSVYLMESDITWTRPSFIITAILGLTIANFIAMVLLEQHRSRLGKLTMPAIATAIAIVLLFVMTEGINRFFRDFGYSWLLPMVLMSMILSYAAIFRERTVALKFHLGFNSLALTVLWCLGSADKIALPF